jgi:hypothetical protein
MTTYPHLAEGDRVAVDYNDCGHMEVRTGTVVQVSCTQPHIAWVDWDDGRRWVLMGTAHLRPADDARQS